MFDVGASELLLIAIVAVVVIGPKDMPMAMRTAGRWIGKMRKVSGHFRSGIDAMVREAELEEMERKWREQNEAIMKGSPQLPSAEDMQAPTSTPSGSTFGESVPPATIPPVIASAAGSSSAGLSSDDAPSGVTLGDLEAAQAGPAHADSGADDAARRQTELHLPPPPP